MSKSGLPILAIWLALPLCALVTSDPKMIGVWAVMLVLYLILAGLMGMFTPMSKNDVLRVDLSTSPEKLNAQTRDEERKHQAALYWRRQHDDESEGE